MTALDGWKTYIVAALGVVSVLVQVYQTGDLTQEQIQQLLQWLGLGAVRSALTK
jgi:hypothetical protein